VIAGSNDANVSVMRGTHRNARDPSARNRSGPLPKTPSSWEIPLTA